MDALPLQQLASWRALAEAEPVLAAVAAVAALLVLLFIVAILQTRAYEQREARFTAGNIAKLAAAAAAATASSSSSGGGPPPPPLTAFVTGANSGIGFMLCEILARAGVRVVLGCRDEKRGSAAVARIKKLVGPSADARLLLVDVADPVSVARAAARLRTDPTLGCTAHLDFLVLNAGIMPVERYRWGVIVNALLTCGWGVFLETSRPRLGSPSFLANPLDDVGACGAPSLFATHVLGHLMLAQDLQGLMAPLGGAGSGAGAGAGAGGGTRLGRIVWTGSRSSDSAQLDWAQLEPPPRGVAAGRGKSGLEILKEHGTERQIDTYAQAKYAQDLINLRLSRLVPTPTTIICPGFVATELTPPFFWAGIPFFKLVRAYAPSMTLNGERGTAAHIAALIAAPGSLSPARKYHLDGDRVSAAVNGAPRLVPEDEERMWRICERWLEVWREKAAAATGGK